MKNQKESELPLNDYFMSKFFRVSLVAAYVGLTAFVPIQALKFWGHFLSPLAILGWFFGWSAYCLVAAQAQVELMLCRMQVRKPLKDEQCRMCGYFDHVLQLAGIARSFQLLILEEPGFNAFATGRRTIVLSRDLLEKMKTPQIEAILAHELGHHVRNDCLTTGVYFAANLPAMYLIEISKLVWQKLCICRRHFKIKRRLLLFFVIIGLVILGIAHMLLPVLRNSRAYIGNQVGKSPFPVFMEDNLEVYRIQAGRLRGSTWLQQSPQGSARDIYAAGTTKL